MTDRGAPGGGKMEGRPIDTIGYRGMHSYEIAFDNWFVAAENQVGLDDGLGRGFYYQMAGFENGRLQTAARAVGVMQAAYEEARQYAADRVVFGQPIADYQLTQAKLARMAVLIQAARQFAYEVARMMGRGEGVLEASMVKAYVCKAAEWVTREAMQIHGGFGYAEEYPVSRYFVDARVLSIFEGADETLCLKVIARRLVTGPARRQPRRPRPESAGHELSSSRRWNLVGSPSTKERHSGQALEVARDVGPPRRVGHELDHLGRPVPAHQPPAHGVGDDVGLIGVVGVEQEARRCPARGRAPRPPPPPPRPPRRRSAPPGAAGARPPSPPGAGP